MNLKCEYVTKSNKIYKQLVYSKSKEDIEINDNGTKEEKGPWHLLLGQIS